MNNIFYTSNIEHDTKENLHFRKVVWTGKHMQIVYMSLLPGQEIGIEIHNHVDQFFRIEEGQAKAIVSDESFELAEDSTLVIPAGSEHNIINTGDGILKLYTIYTPPNHLDRRIHPTKEDANNDIENEDFGHLQESNFS